MPRVPEPSPAEDWGLPNTVEVVAALERPEMLLQAASAGGRGWSEPYGGPEGIAVLAGVLRQRLDAQARDVAALRAAAVAELAREHSLSTIGRALGIGKTMVHKINQSALGGRFASLVTRGEW